MKMLEVNDLTTEFSTENGTVKAVRDVSFYVDKGEVLGVVGASGSGKTTLTEILLGQLKPTCQQFRILENGKPVTAG